jgi:hypothetical protein
MRSPSSKLVVVAVIAVAVAVAVATTASGAVVGERGTRIISPPGGAPATTNSSDSAPGSILLPYVTDGARPDSGVMVTDPIVGTPRPMDNLEFSQDNRIVRYAAFDSLAASLDSRSASDPAYADDGHHHIYLFERNSGGTTTDELLGGTVTRVDPNGGGDSFKPSLDGQTKTGNGAVAPHCVVFQSTSRLTKNDKSDSSSIYLYDIKKPEGKRFKLISGAKPDARDGVVDGTCDSITFESGGTVYLWSRGYRGLDSIARGYNPDQQTDGKGVAYDRGGQVYYQSFQEYSLRKANGKHYSDIVPEGEVLVSNSASDPNKGANGESSMPAVNDNGAYVAFESTATDLCGMPQRCQGVGEDRNGAKKDVFRRTLATDAPTGRTETTRVYRFYAVKVKKGNATKIKYRKQHIRMGNEMEMISYDGVEDFQSDLDSDQVKISGAGEQACFRSFGIETHNHKFRADSHQGPFQHIYFWNAPRERTDAEKLPISRFTGESKAGRTSDTEFVHKDGTAAFNWSCAISSRGNFIGWTSDEEDQSGEANGRSLSDTFIRFMGASDENLGGDLGN